MRKRTAVAVMFVMGAVLAIPVLTAAPALAHEARTVGAYHFLVGFGDEPPYAGLKNSVQLILSDKNGKPVTDLTDTLKVEVISGSQKQQFPLEATFDPDTGLGTPGDYRAWFIPTAPGAYTFHFFGTIGSQKVDESFTSSPTTFDDVVNPTQVEFPNKVPTGTELAGRLDREVPRLNTAIEAAERHADSKANSARTLAIVGIAVGALAVVIAGATLATSRRRGTLEPKATAAASPATRD